MRLLIDADEKEAFRSLSDDHLFRLPDFTIGDIIPVSVAVIQKIVSQFDSNLFIPLDVSDYTIRIGLGAFQLPTQGSFPLTYSAETGGVLASFDPTADELSTILNSISTVVALGGLDVSGEDGFFIATWRLPGARSLIVADATNLVPLSAIDIVEITAGTVSVQEVQSIRISQEIGALATLGTNSASPTITITLVTQGDSTHNHKVRLTFPADRWGGSWTFSAISVTSDLIPHSPGEEEIEAAIEAMVSIGNGNVDVTQEDENNFLVMFKNGRGNQAIAGISADGTTLKVIGTKSGSLDLTGAGMEFLIPEGEDYAVVQLEVESTPGGGSPEKILNEVVILNRAVIA